MAVQATKSLSSRTSVPLQKATTTVEKDPASPMAATNQESWTLTLEHLASIVQGVLSLLRGWAWLLWSEYLPASWKKTLEHGLNKHRYVVVCLVLLPLSVLFDGAWKLRRWYQNAVRPSASLRAHQERIQHVQAQIRAAPPSMPMCTARPTWLAMSIKHALYKNKMVRIDVSALNNVLRIYEERQTVYVEPNCSMGQITRELIPRGWTLAVTPELDDLTVGGLIMGFGVETSSHKFGLFQHTCVAFEMVLPSGDLVRATATENPDLFAAIPWSHGTLGFLVGVEVKIVPALPYVQMTYLPCYSLSFLVETFTAASRENAFDFVEALQYSKDRGVVMIGKMVDQNAAQLLADIHLAPAPKVNVISRYWKPWFFRHCESHLGKGVVETPVDYQRQDVQKQILGYLAQLYSHPKSVFSPQVSNTANTIKATQLFQELIPLRDYYHRHTKSIFWELQDIVPFGNQPWFRYLFGWAVPPHISLLKLTTTDSLREVYDKAHVIQDMLVPVTTLKASILKFHQELDLYPLWLCPMRLLSPPNEKWAKQMPSHHDPLAAAQDIHPATCSTRGGLVSPTPSEQLYVDIGAYGIPRALQWKHIVDKLYGRDPNAKQLENGLTEEEEHILAAGDAQIPADGHDDSMEELHVRVMRRVEAFVRANHGYQALYAECFQTRKEFRQMFDHGLYERLRKEYGCVGRLPDIYDKVNRNARK